MKKPFIYGALLISMISLSVFAAKKIAFVDDKTCIQCGVCEKDCPVEAIDKVKKDGKTRYIVDPEKCTGCGICVKNCPTGAISLYFENALPKVDSIKKIDTLKKTDKPKSTRKEKS